ncbi:ZZ-type zinc finger-containing protein 3 [Smittium culicis]|uniref:ZZ-type zinc finger-containing protein 3 n=1 Tax=Smittium culicis TaxID=133412 RepID=A0A1R1XEU3_9FUNG|nr:ZZ-type zinc finger-containing protein 3 [Smittium culicis]
MDASVLDAKNNEHSNQNSQNSNNDQLASFNSINSPNFQYEPLSISTDISLSQRIQDDPNFEQEYVSKRNRSFKHASNNSYSSRYKYPQRYSSNSYYSNDQYRSSAYSRKPGKINFKINSSFPTKTRKNPFTSYKPSSSYPIKKSGSYRFDRNTESYRYRTSNKSYDSYDYSPRIPSHNYLSNKSLPQNQSANHTHHDSKLIPSESVSQKASFSSDMDISSDSNDEKTLIQDCSSSYLPQSSNQLHTHGLHQSSFDFINNIIDSSHQKITPSIPKLEITQRPLPTNNVTTNFPSSNINTQNYSNFIPTIQNSHTNIPKTPPVEYRNIPKTPPVQSRHIPKTPPVQSRHIPKTPPVEYRNIPKTPPVQSRHIPKTPPVQSRHIPKTPPVEYGNIPKTPPVEYGNIPKTPPVQSRHIPKTPPVKSRYIPKTPPVRSRHIPKTPPVEYENIPKTPPVDSETINISSKKYYKEMSNAPNNKSTVSGIASDLIIKHSYSTIASEKISIPNKKDSLDLSRSFSSQNKNSNYATKSLNINFNSNSKSINLKSQNKLSSSKIKNIQNIYKSSKSASDNLNSFDTYSSRKKLNSFFKNNQKSPSSFASNIYKSNSSSLSKNYRDIKYSESSDKLSESTKNTSNKHFSSLSASRSIDINSKLNNIPKNPRNLNDDIPLLLKNQKSDILSSLENKDFLKNPEFKLVFSTLSLLKQQLCQAVTDLKKLNHLKISALSDPKSYIDGLINKTNECPPKLQNVASVPMVNLEKYFDTATVECLEKYEYNSRSIYPDYSPFENYKDISFDDYKSQLSIIESNNQKRKLKKKIQLNSNLSNSHQKSTSYTKRHMYEKNKQKTKFSRKSSLIDLKPILQTELNPTKDSGEFSSFEKSNQNSIPKCSKASISESNSPPTLDKNVPKKSSISELSDSPATINTHSYKTLSPNNIILPNNTNEGLLEVVEKSSCAQNNLLQPCPISKSTVGSSLTSELVDNKYQADELVPLPNTGTIGKNDHVSESNVTSSNNFRPNPEESTPKSQSNFSNSMDAIEMEKSISPIVTAESINHIPEQIISETLTPIKSIVNVSQTDPILDSQPTVITLDSISDLPITPPSIDSIIGIQQSSFSSKSVIESPLSVYSNEPSNNLIPTNQTVDSKIEVPILVTSNITNPIALISDKLLDPSDNIKAANDSPNIKHCSNISIDQKFLPELDLSSKSDLFSKESAFPNTKIGTVQSPSRPNILNSNIIDEIKDTISTAALYTEPISKYLDNTSTFDAPTCSVDSSNPQVALDSNHYNSQPSKYLSDISTTDNQASFSHKSTNIFNSVLECAPRNIGTFNEDNSMNDLKNQNPKSANIQLDNFENVTLLENVNSSEPRDSQSDLIGVFEICPIQDSEQSQNTNVNKSNLVDCIAPLDTNSIQDYKLGDNIHNDSKTIVQTTAPKFVITDNNFDTDSIPNNDSDKYFNQIINPSNSNQESLNSLNTLSASENIPLENNQIVKSILSTASTHNTNHNDKLLNETQVNSSKDIAPDSRQPVKIDNQVANSNDCTNMNIVSSSQIESSSQIVSDVSQSCTVGHSLGLSRQHLNMQNEIPLESTKTTEKSSNYFSEAIDINSEIQVKIESVQNYDNIDLVNSISNSDSITSVVKTEPLFNQSNNASTYCTIENKSTQEDSKNDVKPSYNTTPPKNRNVELDPILKSIENDLLNFANSFDPQSNRISKKNSAYKPRNKTLESNSGHTGNKAYVPRGPINSNENLDISSDLSFPNSGPLNIDELLVNGPRTAVEPIMKLIEFRSNQKKKSRLKSNPEKVSKLSKKDRNLTPGYNPPPPSVFNKPWSEYEQNRLEELLEIYPDEPVANNRWRKISDALGTRTMRQVASRVQKYFIKLNLAGLPIPGRIPDFSKWSSLQKEKRKSSKKLAAEGNIVENTAAPARKKKPKVLDEPVSDLNLYGTSDNNSERNEFAELYQGSDLFSIVKGRKRGRKPKNFAGYDVDPSLLETEEFSFGINEEQSLPIRKPKKAKDQFITSDSSSVSRRASNSKAREVLNKQGNKSDKLSSNNFSEKVDSEFDVEINIESLDESEPSMPIGSFGVEHSNYHPGGSASKSGKGGVRKSSKSHNNNNNNNSKFLENGDMSGNQRKKHKPNNSASFGGNGKFRSNLDSGIKFREHSGGNSTDNYGQTNINIPNSVLHVGYRCDNCYAEPIVGTRWHCIDCSSRNRRKQAGSRAGNDMDANGFGKSVEDESNSFGVDFDLCDECMTENNLAFQSGVFGVKGGSNDLVAIHNHKHRFLPIERPDFDANEDHEFDEPDNLNCAYNNSNHVDNEDFGDLAAGDPGNYYSGNGPTSMYSGALASKAGGSSKNRGDSVSRPSERMGNIGDFDYEDFDFSEIDGNTQSIFSSIFKDYEYLA